MAHIDVLSLIDDGNIKLYRPDWNQFTGDVKATLFLQQVTYWWGKKARQPFWKFSSPCNHRWYKPGDSWQEELGFTRHEFNTARSRVSQKAKCNSIIKSSLVTYWTDSDNVTWYLLNSDKLISCLLEIYPARNDGVVGIQVPIPEAGNRQPEAGNRQPEAGSKNPKAGNRQPEAGNRQPEAGNRQPEARTRKPETGNPTIAKITTTKNTTKNTTTTTPTPPTAVADSDNVVVVVDELILDWMGFVGRLKESEKFYATSPYLLAWAWYVKIKQDTNPYLNTVGIFRKQLPGGQWPNSQLRSLANSWLDMSGPDKSILIECLEFADSSGYLEIPDNFPYEIDTDTLHQIWQSTSGHPAPPHLMPTELEQPEPEPTAGTEKIAYQMTAEDARIWKACLQSLESKVIKAELNTWLLPAMVQTTNGRIENIYSFSDYASDQIEKMRPLITEAIGHDNWRVIAQ